MEANGMFEVLTADECRLIVDDFDRTTKNDESGGFYYGKSNGIANLKSANSFVERIEKTIKKKYPDAVFENSYAREYLNDSYLKPHIDRDGLDVTLSVCLLKTYAHPWPLSVSNREFFGSWRHETDTTPFKEDYVSFDMPQGWGVTCEGRRFPHWREHLWCEPGQRGVFVFFHWRCPSTVKATPVPTKAAAPSVAATPAVTTSPSVGVSKDVKTEQVKAAADASAINTDAISNSAGDGRIDRGERVKAASVHQALTQRMAALRSEILTGGASSLADYQFKCGVLKGLSESAQMLNLGE